MLVPHEEKGVPEIDEQKRHRGSGPTVRFIARFPHPDIKAQEVCSLQKHFATSDKNNPDDLIYKISKREGP